MQRNRFHFLLALAVVALAYVCVKGYLYYSVKEQVERGIAMARPYAAVSYSGIASSLAGSVSVEGLEFRTPDQVLPLRIDELRLSGDGPGFLLDLTGGFGSGRVPAVMNIDLRRIALPDINDLLPEGMTLSKDAGSPMAGPVDPCGLNGLLQRIGLLRSDAYPLIMHVSNRYELDAHANSGHFEFGYRVEGRESVKVQASISAIPQRGAMFTGAMPVVEGVSIAYRPGREHVSGMVSACARTKGLSMPLYVGGLLAQPDKRIAREMGFVPGPGLRRALERILLQPESVLVELGPVEDPSLFMTPGLSPQRAMDLLNLRLSVNDEAVDDLSYRLASAVDDGLDDAAGFSGYGGSEKAQSAMRAPMRFIDTPVSELDQYLGREVRLYVLKHERPHRGVLVQVGDGEASVEKRIHRGKITVHSPLEGVVKAEVKRYPDAER